MASDTLTERAKRARAELEAIAQAVETIAASVPAGGGGGVTIVNNFGGESASVPGVNPTRHGISSGTSSIGPGGTGTSHGLVAIGSGGGSGGAGILVPSDLERALRFFGIVGDKAKQARENEALAIEIVRMFLAELARRNQLTPGLGTDIRIGGS